MNISKFKSIRDSKNPITVNLLEWLCDESNQNAVKELRTLSGEDYKNRKKQLSVVTPSGTFYKRSTAGLIKHSGLIQFDVDYIDNPVNMEELKTKIQDIPFVAYCGFSVSGAGLWGLIPIKHPKRHKDHFKAIQKAFNNVGIKIDPAPSNVSSPRFISYDAEPYFNHNAEIFHYLIEDAKPLPSGGDNLTNVEQLIRKIEHLQTDITKGYKNWLKIGFALAEEFGESGRKYFHQVSQWHSEYSITECDNQFTNCLQANGKGVSIASFFHICKEHNITLK